MTRDEIYAAWAPRQSPWSNWAKPAAFAHLPRDLTVVEESGIIDVTWAPSPVDRTALVVDLPGSAAVRCGIALAAKGYRPVPIFNAIPSPVPSEGLSVVQIEPQLAALMAGAESLRAATIADDAPPAFLIDADRQAVHNPPIAGAFDNRSVVFTTDFPSAARLALHGIGRVVLVRERANGLGADLVAALRLWQKDDVNLAAKWLTEPGDPAPFVLPRQHWWTRLRNRMIVALRFRRNAAGEFGEFIPHAAAGG